VTEAVAHNEEKSMMFRAQTLRVLAASSALMACGAAAAADHVVSMLNTGKDGSMVFEPSYVRVAVGDTVIFKPVQPGGHNAVSLLVPDGAQPFNGGIDQETRVKIEREGVYLYLCQPHKPMGMVGVIQAGKPVNLAAARAAATKEQASFALGKDRFDNALAQVK
jgi:pseudoazurin